MWGAAGSATAGVYDNFTDTDGTLLENHTADTGQGWVANGTDRIRITSNRCWSNGNSGPQFWVLNYTPSSANYSVKSSILVASSGEASLAIAGRVDTASNTGYIAIMERGVWKLYSVVSGSATLLDSYTGDVPTTAKTAELIMNGTAISVKVDTVTRISVTNGAITSAGKAGIGSFYSHYGTQNYLDNWELVQ